MTTQERKVMNMFVKASLKFVRKVETGRARSVETYDDLKMALKAARRLSIDLYEDD
jgi:hypothetical protein